MSNIISDSEGDLFVTASGKLRLALSRRESAWSTPGETKKLIWVATEENGLMIWNELGVYAGERLGTPCDDL
jgi:hypothetical protein